ncbi:MAG TPA: hypothetical protein VFT95_07755, partial [Micromonosporaceae bacterium]|nr:hypothetical protein [Micromonosporaceae bacterium]
MSVSATLGTALGLVLVFALLALFCSGITETIANLTQRRAGYLLTGLRAMLDRPEAEPTPGMSGGQAKQRLSRLTKNPERTKAAAAAVQGEPTEPVPAESTLTLALFDHPLVKSLQTRRTKWLRRRDGALRNPQYISPEVFTRALIDTVLPVGPGPVAGS